MTACAVALGADDFSAGPLFDSFPLTLESGHRTEALGPFFDSQATETGQSWAVPPLLSHVSDPDVEYAGFDVLYPILTYRHFGKEYRWQFCELFSFSGGQQPDDNGKKRFTLFPFYFQQRSPDPKEDYTALLPFYGHLKDRLFRDDIFFVMFPLYAETRKKDVITDNYLCPFFHLRHGDGLKGWQLWPVVGNEHKEITTHTNGFGDAELVPGHDKFFALWPLYLRENTGIGSDDPERFRALLPLYAIWRSPKRDSTSVLWPFFTWIDDREKKYHEWQGPYPFVVVSRGEGKTGTRFWPLFGMAHSDVYEDNFLLWPLYKYNRAHADPLDEKRTRICYYLYSNGTEKNTQTGEQRHRVSAWPFFTYSREFNGNSRLQILALIEPYVPGSSAVERDWSPLWSIWRSERNPKTGANSQSFFWNLYRRDATPDSKKCSLLLGLFQYQSNPEHKKLRLFYIPVFKSHARGTAPVK